MIEREEDELSYLQVQEVAIVEGGGGGGVQGDSGAWVGLGGALADERLTESRVHGRIHLCYRVVEYNALTESIAVGNTDRMRSYIDDNIINNEKLIKAL